MRQLAGQSAESGLSAHWDNCLEQTNLARREYLTEASGRRDKSAVNGRRVVL